MIDSLLNLAFRCSHRTLTRPVTPVSKGGVPHGQTYVVCLDCGKQFAYDLKEMRVGKPLDKSDESGVLDPETKKSNRKLKYALWASLPLAVAAGAFLRNNKKAKEARPDQSVRHGVDDVVDPKTDT
jgi:DNA-directed RNA polymerase subunit RPC12/RpoP